MTTPNAVAVASQTVNQPTYEELKARLAELERKAANKGSVLKVTAKGGISHYCLGKFPVTLTKKQWQIVSETVKSGKLEAFIADNDAMLYQGSK